VLDRERYGLNSIYKRAQAERDVKNLEMSNNIPSFGDTFLIVVIMMYFCTEEERINIITKS
jgi:hypothetical protein